MANIYSRETSMWGDFLPMVTGGQKCIAGMVY